MARKIKGYDKFTVIFHRDLLISVVRARVHVKFDFILVVYPPIDLNRINSDFRFFQLLKMYEL